MMKMDKKTAAIAAAMATILLGGGGGTVYGMFVSQGQFSQHNEEAAKHRAAAEEQFKRIDVNIQAIQAQQKILQEINDRTIRIESQTEPRRRRR